jgi:hypothetical protein
MAAELTPLQKRALFEDGYVVLPGAVAPPLVAAARARLAAAGKHTYQDEALETSAEFCDLVNKSSLTPILREAMGPFDPPSRGFAATIFPQASNGTLALGTEASKDAKEPDYNLTPTAQAAGARGGQKGMARSAALAMGGHVEGKSELVEGEAKAPGQGAAAPRPFFGAGLHIDGVPSFEVDPATGDYGAAEAATLGSNRTPFFMDPARTLAVCSFTVFVGVALSDQTAPGRGNLAVLRGAHHAVQAFFRMQRAKGGPLGPEGPGWPRVERDEESGE